MFKEFKSRDLILEETLTHFQGIGFEEVDHECVLRSGFMNTSLDEEVKDPHLNNIAFAYNEDSVQIRMGPIDTPFRANELSIFLKWICKQFPKKKFPLRVSSVQLNLSDSEWDAISLQHYLLLQHSIISNDSFQMAHVNFPAEFVFQNHIEEKSIFQIKTINKLSRQINSRGWIQYCKWLNEEMEKILTLIPLDALDEYQLEAAIKDFSHEVSSALLSNYCIEADRIILQLGEKEIQDEASSSNLDYHQKLEILKQLLELRFEIRDDLQWQHDVLGELIVKIGKIVKQHPELIHIKNMCRLLRVILDSQIDFTGKPAISWGMDILLLGLLDAHLDVVSIVNCSTDVERTNIAFAIKLAILQMFNSYDSSQVIDLVFHWDSVIPLINKSIVEKGYHDDPLFHQRAKLAKQLRFFVLENLHSFCSNFKTQSTVLDERFAIFPEYLNFLPFHIKTVHDSFDLVVYNHETGIPEKLTQKGLSFLARFFSV